MAGRASDIKMGGLMEGGLLISLDGVVSTRTVGVSASFYLLQHHNVHKKLSSGTGSPGWSWKKGCNPVVVLVVV